MSQDYYLYRHAAMPAVIALLEDSTTPGPTPAEFVVLLMNMAERIDTLERRVLDR